MALSWLEEEKTGSKRKGTTRTALRGNPILRVNARARDQRRHRMQVIGVILLVPVALGGVLLLGWQGFRLGNRLLFSSNPRFKIRTIEIHSGGAMINDYIRGRCGIVEGANLFAFNIREIRDEFLQRAPGYRTMDLTRVLPDTLRVEVSERVPLARVGAGGNLVTDRTGRVFYGRPAGLPVILNYQDRALQPGSVLKGMAIAALEILDVCDDPRLGIEINQIELGSHPHLVVRADFNGLPKRVELSWKDMGTGTAASRNHLKKKLGQLLAAVDSPQGRQITQLDATYTDQIYGR